MSFKILDIRRFLLLNGNILGSNLGTRFCALFAKALCMKDATLSLIQKQFVGES
jgi:hypothetical protein